MSHCEKTKGEIYIYGIGLLILGGALFMYGVGNPYLDLLNNKQSITFEMKAGFAGFIGIVCGLLFFIIPETAYTGLSGKKQPNLFSILVLGTLLASYIMMDQHIEKLKKDKGYISEFENSKRR